MGEHSVPSLGEQPGPCEVRAVPSVVEHCASQVNEQHDGEHCEPSLGGHGEPSVGEQCGPMHTMMWIPPGPPYNAFGTHCVGFGSWHHLVDSGTPERLGSTLVGGSLLDFSVGER